MWLMSTFLDGSIAYPESINHVTSTQHHHHLDSDNLQNYATKSAYFLSEPWHFV